ncbi:hypothetical protein ACFLRW_03570 [Acidobacteriota bacterium]
MKNIVSMIMRKNILTSLLFFMGLLSVITNATSAIIDTETRQIPFELNRNKIILPLRVNDSRVLKVILDTGMPSKGAMLFDPILSEEIELKNANRFEVKGAGRGEKSYVLRDESVTFTFGEIKFQNQPLMILQNDRMSGFPTDGVVGNILFGSAAVKIDYDNKVISLLEENDLKLEDGWDSIELRFNQSGIPFIDAALSVKGEEQVNLNIYIDSASGEALELLVKPDMKFPLPDQLEKHYLGRGLSGDIYGQIGLIKKFSISTFTLFDVPTAFPKAEIRSRQEGADGILCNRALQRFNVIFDFAGKKLYLKPNQSFNNLFK